MTKAAYLEYFRQWLASTVPPDVEVTATDEMIITRRNEEIRIGYPMRCDCHDEQCLGWIMVQMRTPKRTRETN